MADGVGGARRGVGAGAGGTADGGRDEDVATEGEPEPLVRLRKGEAEQAAVVGEDLFVLKNDRDRPLWVGQRQRAAGGCLWRRRGLHGRGGCEVADEKCLKLFASGIGMECLEFGSTVFTRVG